MQRYSLRLLKSLPHPCGYFPDRMARNVILDPASEQADQDYAHALPLGFRRAGNHVYRPQCHGCRACVPCRIPTAGFHPGRNLRRCLKRNQDLDIRVCPPGLTDERHDLYSRYLSARHPGGGMDPASPDDFDGFLDAPWSKTHFIEARLRGRLLAVAVTDRCDSGLSAVYTFYDPDIASRSLGTWAILQQVDLTEKMNLPHLYLGYWIASHPKMQYKARFPGIEILGDKGWKPLAENHVATPLRRRS